MRPEPDLAGYRDAQIALIGKLGADVPFFTPSAETWPPGTAMDPESGRPFDPTIAPTASGFSSAVVRAGVVVRSIGLSRRGVTDEAAQTALGVLGEGEGILIVPEQDFHDNNLEDATQCEVREDRWEVTEKLPDGLENTPHRRLLFIRQL